MSAHFCLHATPGLPPSHPSPLAEMASVAARGLLSLGRLDPSTLTGGARGHSRVGGGLLWGKRARSSFGSTMLIQESRIPLLEKIEDKVVKDVELRWMGLCRGAAAADAPKLLLDAQPEPPEATWNRQVGRTWGRAVVSSCSSRVFSSFTLWRISAAQDAAVGRHTSPCPGGSTGTAHDIHLFGVPRSCEDQNAPQP